MIALSGPELDKLIADTLPQLDDHHTGAFVLSATNDGVVFGVEFKRTGDYGELDLDAAVKWDVQANGKPDLSGGARAVWRW